MIKCPKCLIANYVYSTEYIIVDCYCLNCGNVWLDNVYLLIKEDHMEEDEDRCTGCPGCDKECEEETTEEEGD